MYRPTLIIAENLFSFVELRYKLANGVTTLVNGENKDNDSQESNGSGKSALIEALAIAITGGPLRKVKNDEIINDFANEAFLSLQLENDVLDETMIISRRFFRKSASVVNIQTFKGGVEIDDPLLKTLSGVDEYNKEILSRLGLTRDEVFNNFTLSKHRYVNFFNVSDTKKKEIINQFSRGNALNQAIDELKKKGEPVQEELDDIALEVATITSRYDTIKEQLDEFDAGEADRIKVLGEKLAEVDEKIAEFRRSIRTNKSEKKTIQESLDACEDIIEDIDDALEDGEDDTPEDQLNALIKIIDDNELKFEQNFIDKLNEIKASVEKYDIEIEADTKVANEQQKKVDDLKAEIQNLQDAPELDELKNSKAIKALKGKIEELDESIESTSTKIQSIKSKGDLLQEEHSQLSVRLMGKITCPKCEHVFLAAEDDFDVAAGEVKLADLNDQISLNSKELTTQTSKETEFNSDKDGNENEIKVINSAFTMCSEKLSSLTRRLDNVKLEVEAANLKIENNRQNIKSIDTKIDKFIKDSYDDVAQHVEDIIDEEDGLADQISDLNRTNKSLLVSISTQEERAETLKANDSTNSKADIQTKLSDAKKDKRAIEAKHLKKEAELNRFLEQIEIFTSFKAHLANEKIEDLGNITNDFLESIGSDLRVELSGYTKLKSGKIREKISIKLLRDGLDAGSFGKFSGGEQARISLANILALNKLININCDEGKGLDLLILDEILEAVDGSGLAAMLSALNSSKLTCVVVSHGLIAENYEYKQVVIKEGGESRIENTI